MAEAIFKIFKINRQETKYNYIVAAIDLKTAYEVIDIIRNPPRDNPYDQSKTEIIKRVSFDSNSRRFLQLLS